MNYFLLLSPQTQSFGLRKYMGKYSLGVRKAGSHSEGPGSYFNFGIPILDFAMKHKGIDSLPQIQFL